MDREDRQLTFTSRFSTRVASSANSWTLESGWTAIEPLLTENIRAWGWGWGWTTINYRSNVWYFRPIQRRRQRLAWEHREWARDWLEDRREDDMGLIVCSSSMSMFVYREYPCFRSSLEYPLVARFSLDCRRPARKEEEDDDVSSVNYIDEWPRMVMQM